MEFKKLIVIFTITITVITMCLLGFSYAWYSLSDSGTTFTNISTTNPNLAIVFKQSEFINTTTGVPIADADVASKADKTAFTITADAAALTGYKVAVEIALVNITIDSALKVNDFKYQLLETVNGTTTTIASGTGVDFSNTTKIVKNMSHITLGTVYSYELRVWLHETNISQNTLMNKKFGAQIKVSSAVKK